MRPRQGYTHSRSGFGRIINYCEESNDEYDEDFFVEPDPAKKVQWPVKSIKGHRIVGDLFEMLVEWGNPEVDGWDDPEVGE